MSVGNVSTAEQVITIVDTTAPVFLDYEVQIDMPCDMIDDAILVEAEDNCCNVVITYEDQIVSGGCAGVIIRDYTAVDDCGNESYAQQIINLIDDEAPEFTVFPEDNTVECDDVPSVDEGGPAGMASQELMMQLTGMLILVAVTVLLKLLKDELTVVGNDNDFSGIVTMATIPCGDGGVFTFDWDFVTFDVDGPSFDPAFYVNGDMFQLTDDFGADGQSGAMSLNCAAGDVIGFAIESTDGSLGEAVLTITNFTYEGGVTVAAEDNCDDDVDITYDGEEIVPGDCEGSYTIIRTWTATDHCLNSVSQSQTITVIDTTPPVFHIRTSVK